MKCVFFCFMRNVFCLRKRGFCTRKVVVFEVVENERRNVLWKVLFLRRKGELTRKKWICTRKVCVLLWKVEIDVIFHKIAWWIGLCCRILQQKYRKERKLAKKLLWFVTNWQEFLWKMDSVKKCVVEKRQMLLYMSVYEKSVFFHQPQHTQFCVWYWHCEFFVVILPVSTRNLSKNLMTFQDCCKFAEICCYCCRYCCRVFEFVVKSPKLCLCFLWKIQEIWKVLLWN